MSTVVEVSQEAIRYQGRSELFTGLIEAIEKKIAYVKDYRFATAGNVPTDDLQSLVRKHTGLDITFIIEPMEAYNLYVKFPPIHLRHPLLQQLQSALREANAGPYFQQQALKKAKLVSNEFVGMIDLENSKIRGQLEGFPATVRVPSVLFDGYISPSELAAFFLHEIGHVFSYLENLFGTVSTNITILTAWQEYANAIEPKQKIKLLDELFAELKIKNLRPEDIDVMKTKEEFTTVILSGRAQEVRSALGSAGYDKRAFEVASDQFAVRHGAGRDLIIGLDKIDRHYKLGAYEDNTAVYACYSAAMGVTFILMTLFPWTGWIVFAAGFLAFLTTPTEHDFKIQDNPVERLDRAIQEMIQISKGLKKNDSQLSQVLDDIKSLEMMRHVVKNNESIFSLVWRNMTARRRDQHKQHQFQMQLEELINNRLYVHSIQLNQLAKK